MIKVTVNKLPDSEVELEGELPTEQFTTYRAPALAEINKRVNIDGFRPGQASDLAIAAKLGEEKILVEMAELALQKIYPDLIEQEKLDVIGRPNITITKLAKDNPLGFKIKTALTPEVKLADYAALAKKINSEPVAEIKVEDKEVDDLINEVRKSRAKDGVEPELNDDFAKSVGKFENLADLKTKLGQNLKQDKELRARDKRRLQIIDEIIKASTIPLPPVLVEAEIDKMLAEMKYETEKMKLKWEEYLGHLKKSEADLKTSWQADAKKRVQTGLVLAELALKEKIVPSEEEIKKELDHLKSHYPHTDDGRLRQYVNGLITNEKVFVWLESQK